MIAPAVMCIALAIHFEARGESVSGQIAVGHVIQNRVRDDRYPDNSCDVVKQGYYWQIYPIRHRCQFSFWCDGLSDDPKDKQSWYNSLYLATVIDRLPDKTGGATHYHADYVYPHWAVDGRVTAQIEGHIFYRIHK